MSWANDFKELAEELRDLAERFEKRQPRDQESGRFVSKDDFDYTGRIRKGVSDTLKDDIVPQAKQRAVPSDESGKIMYQTRSWNEHYFYARSELIKYHEYGTSTRADDYKRATINAPGGNGYIIPLDGYDALPFGPDDLPNELDFRYAVHPGVKGRHFMKRALRRNIHNMEENIADELDKIGKTW